MDKRGQDEATCCLMFTPALDFGHAQWSQLIDFNHWACPKPFAVFLTSCGCFSVKKCVEMKELGSFGGGGEACAGKFCM